MDRPELPQASEQGSTRLAPTPNLRQLGYGIDYFLVSFLFPVFGDSFGGRPILRYLVRFGGVGRAQLSCSTSSAQGESSGGSGYFSDSSGLLFDLVHLH